MTVAELIAQLKAEGAEADTIERLQRLPQDALVAEWDPSPASGTAFISIGDLSGSRGALAW